MSAPPGYPILGLLICAAAASSLSPPGAARAQYFDRQIQQGHEIESPERFALELRIGPYIPGDPQFDSSARDHIYDDNGLLLAGELDVTVLRVPYFGILSVGAGLGWASYTAKARSASDATTQEELSFVLLPLTGVAVLRVDVLARQLGIPFVFTGKLGMDAMVWDSNKGKSDEANGVIFGLHWALQMAIELDFFDLQAARTLDDGWGINHTFVFFELFGAEARGAPVVGDRTWSGGLGFIF